MYHYNGFWYPFDEHIAGVVPVSFFSSLFFFSVKPQAFPVFVLSKLWLLLKSLNGSVWFGLNPKHLQR